MIGVGQKASAKVVAVHPDASPPTVDVSLLGGTAEGLRYPLYYTPQVDDLVIVEWVGTQPFVGTIFA